MKYQQLSAQERFLIASLRIRNLGFADIAAELGRDRSTIWREVRRNRSPYDNGYRSERAQEHTNARRKRSRRNHRLGAAEFARVEALLRENWSPEQISGHLRRTGEMSISHETIYRHVRRDFRGGGDLFVHLRCSRKRRRKGYGRHDSRGRLAGKRMIGERPAAVEERKETGHWEIDTVMGKSQEEGSECILTLVERKSGYVLIGKLAARTSSEATRATIELIERHPEQFKTITADNGSEFHGYEAIEAATGVIVYFATPHHSWERGTNENTNGLIRQYLPKGQTMTWVRQRHCEAIAQKLNERPRKRHAYKTPNQCFNAK